MTIIEKIRAEIERRITDNTFGAKLELIDILAWLDTLESEKPMNQDELEEEIEIEWDSFNKHLAEYDDDDSDEVIWLNKFSFTDIARHFAQWGAEHLKK